MIACSKRHLKIPRTLLHSPPAVCGKHVRSPHITWRPFGQTHGLFVTSTAFVGIDHQPRFFRQSDQEIKGGNQAASEKTNRQNLARSTTERTGGVRTDRAPPAEVIPTRPVGSRGVSHFAEDVAKRNGSLTTSKTRRGEMDLTLLLRRNATHNAAQRTDSHCLPGEVVLPRLLLCFAGLPRRLVKNHELGVTSSAFSVGLRVRPAIIDPDRFAGSAPSLHVCNKVPWLLGNRIKHIEEMEVCLKWMLGGMMFQQVFTDSRSQV